MEKTGKKNKCEECEVIDSSECKRCKAYFCIKHIQTHLKTKICPRCETERCNEWFEVIGIGSWNPNICFFCNTSSMLLSGIAKNKVTIPDSINFKQDIKNPREFTSKMIKICYSNIIRQFDENVK
uniref:Uncharacterized protein n=1 Tax=Pithovirus LCPAC001 TaxID=2506585 RepID=A0A481Z1T0_9VIRU|nr:MAG: hypothetical protein LCPAC001_01230 [Pithovirus LCPAC001]